MAACMNDMRKHYIKDEGYNVGERWASHYIKEKGCNEIRKHGSLRLCKTDTLRRKQWRDLLPKVFALAEKDLYGCIRNGKLQEKVTRVDCCKVKTVMSSLRLIAAI